jgi:insecticidal toxin complex protein TccC
MSTSLFSKTPTITVSGSRGLAVRDIDFCRHPGDPGVTRTLVTRHRYDARGVLTQSADPRLNDAGLANFSYITALAGSVIRASGADNGTVITLNDVAAQPFFTVSNVSTNDDGTDAQSQAMTRT